MVYGPRRVTPVRERLMRRVLRDASGCWLWQGAVQSAGYGVIGAGRNALGVRYVHRVAYEIFIGPIPEGLHIDHICCVRTCVNPDHLQAVTQAENNRLAVIRNRATA